METVSRYIIFPKFLLFSLLGSGAIPAFLGERVAGSTSARWLVLCCKRVQFLFSGSLVQHYRCYLSNVALGWIGLGEVHTMNWVPNCLNRRGKCVERNGDCAEKHSLSQIFCVFVVRFWDYPRTSHRESGGFNTFMMTRLLLKTWSVLVRRVICATLPPVSIQLWVRFRWIGISLWTEYAGESVSIEMKTVETVPRRIVFPIFSCSRC